MLSRLTHTHTHGHGKHGRGMKKKHVLGLVHRNVIPSRVLVGWRDAPKNMRRAAPITYC